MGTSVNQSSPATPLWLGANEAYKHESISIERVVKEVWRASNGDKDGLAKELCSEDIQIILKIALSENRPAYLADRLSEVMANHPRPSIATQIVCRAAIQTCSETNRMHALTSRIFSEAANYLVSRDLPGYVGSGERIRNIPTAFEFKRAVVEHVLDRASVFSRTSTDTIIESPQAWAGYSTGMVAFLARTKGD